jgi:hypothetical protein
VHILYHSKYVRITVIHLNFIEIIEYGFGKMTLTHYDYDIIYIKSVIQSIEDLKRNKMKRK